MERGNAYAAVVRRIAPDAELIGVRPLAGGMSAQITALDLQRPGRAPTTVIVRQYGPKNIAADPQVATTETTLLRLLRSAGLPVPAPLYADDDPALLGGPYCVVEFIDADGPPPVWSTGLAEQLVDVLIGLHRLPVGQARRVLPAYTDRVQRWLARHPQHPDEAMRETRIRTVLAEHWPAGAGSARSILHGDFWPGNTMWRDGRLAAVIDWEDAAVGDPRSDLANLRLELVWAYGPQAAAEATRLYAERGGRDGAVGLSAGELSPAGLALWDLAAAARPVGRLDEWGLDPDRMDLFLSRFQGFVDAALDAFSAAGRAGA